MGMIMQTIKIKVLDKYLIWELLKNFIYSLIFFTTLLLVVRFGEKEIGTFIAKKMSLLSSLKSLLLQVPGYIIQIAPPSMLFATFFSLGRMAQNNEITAMKACGISLYRVFMPVFVTSLLITFLMIAFNDQVVTWATGKDIDIKGLNPQTPGTASKVVFISSGSHVFYIDYISLHDRSMNNVTIYEMNEDNSVKSDVFAKEASWSGKVWSLKNGVTRIFNEGRWVETPFRQKDIVVSEDPEIMVKGSQSQQRMTLLELSKLIGYKKKTGQVVRKDLVSFHSRISFPFACFVMAVLGAPLFIMFGRSGMAVGFLLTMFITFIYWGIAIAIFEALGNNGKLPAMLSCWTANLLFMAIGAVFVYKVKK
jgi:lipopolysaccharide export system permease protein